MGASSVTQGPRSTKRVGMEGASGHPPVCQISALYLKGSSTRRTQRQNSFWLVQAAARPERDRRPQWAPVHYEGHRVRWVARVGYGPVGLWPWLIIFAGFQSRASCTRHMRRSMSGPALLSFRRIGPSPLKTSRRSAQPFARHKGAKATEPHTHTHTHRYTDYLAEIFFPPAYQREVMPINGISFTFTC